MRGTNGLDSIGLPVRDLTGRGAPIVVLYGPSGGGKSTQAVRAFNQRQPYCLVTRPNALHPYESYRLLHPDENLTPLVDIASASLPDIGKDGKPVDVCSIFEKIVTAFARACFANACPYNAFIVDEYATLLARAETWFTSNSKYVSKSGFIDTRTAYRELRRWQSRMFGLLRASGRAVILICHEQAPSYNEDSGDPQKNKPASPTFGEMRYPGGPNIRPASMINPTCQEADAVLRLVVEDTLDGTRRFFSTQVSPKWVAKFPDFDVKPEEALDLYGLLKRAHYTV